jgi:chromatin remodeling complex protein RSC6
MSKPNALQKPVQPSSDLAAVVGSQPLARSEVVSKIWEYIKRHNLQNPENRREIFADGTLRKIFGKDKVTMFELNKHLGQHLS